MKQTLSDTLWAVGLAGLGRGGELPVKGLESPAIGNSEAIGLPNRSTFNAMHHLDNGGVVLSTRDHDTGDRITESRSR
jgi:hypothetical protein